MTSRGFTIVELLVVVAIIMVLAALAIPGLSMLRNSSKRVATVNTITSLTGALDSYLADFGILGDVRDATSSDFTADPVLYLNRREAVAGRSPRLDLLPRQGLRRDAGGWSPVKTLDEANAIADGWGRPIEFRIKSVAGARGYTHAVEIRSFGADGAEGDDDVSFVFSATTGRWVAQ